MNAPNRDSNQAKVMSIVRAGHREEIEELLDSTVRNAHAGYAAIRADGSRSEDWKREQIAAAYRSARERLNEQIDKMASRYAADERLDYAKVFGVDGLSGDRATLTIARRDAYDRLRTTDPDALDDLLEHATKVGDESLARAVAERAFEEGRAALLNRFLSTRPELDSTVQRMWDSRNRTNGIEPFSVVMTLASLQPAELSGVGQVSGAVRG
jgi:hypothetical protein